jgi:hypothetical protein
VLNLAGHAIKAPKFAVSLGGSQANGLRFKRGPRRQGLGNKGVTAFDFDQTAGGIRGKVARAQVYVSPVPQASIIVLRTKL